MIHTSRYDQTKDARCGGTLVPYGPWRSYPAADLHRCDRCGQIGVPYIPAPKTRSRPGNPCRTLPERLAC